MGLQSLDFVIQGINAQLLFDLRRNLGDPFSGFIPRLLDFFLGGAGALRDDARESKETGVRDEMA